MTIDKFGLKPGEIEQISTALYNNVHVERAVMFGSRALGTYRQGSDVDIALDGILLDFGDLSELTHVLNETTSMPYKFDLVLINTIDNEDLKAHIQRAGILIKKPDTL